MSWRALISFILRFLAGILESSIGPPGGKGRRRYEGDFAPEHAEDDFRIFQHEIWYTHSCYLSTDISDLKNAAEKVLDAGLAVLAALPDGRCAWRADGQVVFGDLEEKDTIGATSTQFRLPMNLDPELKGQVGESAMMRSAERMLFGGNDFLGPYARLFLPKIRLHLDESDHIETEIRVKLFANGIVLLSFFLSEKGDLDLETFVRRRVNLGQVNLAAIEAPQDFSLLLMRAIASENIPFWRRWQVLRTRKALRKHYRKGSLDEEGVPYIQFTGSDTSTLAGFGLELVQALAYCLGKPRDGISYLVMGEPKDPRWTGFWSASPHVHLLHFSGQQISAELNQRLHQDSLMRILSRTPPSTGQLLGVPPPQSLRKFDDVGIYANEAILLWVYAALTEEPIMEGIRESPLWAPTLHHEVKGEAIEFGPMLYRSLIHELEDRDLSWDRVLSVWERTAQFELALADAGRFGEIRETIKAGLEARGMTKLSQLAERNLTLRERTAAVEESRRLSAVGVVLTVTIGLLGLPSFVQFVGETLLPIFGLGTPGSVSSLAASVLISVLGLAGVIVVSFRIVHSRRWIRWESSSRRQ